MEREPTPDQELLRALAAYAIGAFIVVVALLLLSSCSSAWQNTPCAISPRGGVMCEGTAATVRCRPDPTGRPYPAGEVSILIDGAVLPFRILAADLAVCLPGDLTETR